MRNDIISKLTNDRSEWFSDKETCDEFGNADLDNLFVPDIDENALIGLDLSEEDLSFTDLSNLCLDGVNFSDANLIGCSFPSDLNNVNFANADLSGILIMEGSIKNCNFYGAEFNSGNIENESCIGLTEFVNTHFGHNDIALKQLFGAWYDDEMSGGGIIIDD